MRQCGKVGKVVKRNFFLLDGRAVVLEFWIQVFGFSLYYLGRATPVVFGSDGSDGPAWGVTRSGHVSIPSVTNFTQV